MSTLLIHIETEAQEKAVKAVLEALQISFEQEVDETEYLMSSPAMVAKIDEARNEARQGKGTKIDTKDLWK
ncbi:MAG TPA: DUF2683 family protein [Mucilaginibacter sp.]